MKKPFAVLIAIFSLGTSVSASPLPQPGDYFLISRDAAGQFVGSHKLFKDFAPDMQEVTYCASDYYVRSSSVAWTQLEVERGNVVHVEYNFGRGWRPICANPEQEVTLRDVGVLVTAREYLASLENDKPSASRLAAFGAMFRPANSDNPEGSFHSR
ncbi:hypothetical protein ABVF61_25665 [Roseibium sp. HPY-6]|uniref:hypothetical protein n=1 Tax=Roseibium sp. HPY-6 TaxID=3229852 RepID=UPI00338E7D06